MVSLAVYKAQRRRAVLAAQAAARRRTVIGLALCLLGLVACVAVINYTTNYWLLIPAGLGAFLGTWVGMRLRARQKQ